MSFALSFHLPALRVTIVWSHGSCLCPDCTIIFNDAEDKVPLRSLAFLSSEDCLFVRETGDIKSCCPLTILGTVMSKGCLHVPFTRHRDLRSRSYSFPDARPRPGRYLLHHHTVTHLFRPSQIPARRWPRPCQRLACPNCYPPQPAHHGPSQQPLGRLSARSHPALLVLVTLYRLTPRCLLKNLVAALTCRS